MPLMSAYEIELRRETGVTMLANPCLYFFFVSTQNQPNESRLLGQIIQYKINLMKVIYWAKSSNSKSKAGIGLTHIPLPSTSVTSC